MNPNSSEAVNASFITFYSFKGGVGRSMALINTAAILASRGFRVLVLDLDLEAPGLSYLQPSTYGDDSVTALEVSDQVIPTPQHGFVDLMLDAAQNGITADLFSLDVHELRARYTREYSIPHDERDFNDGSLHIMPAGMLTADYAKRFDALNLRGLYEDGLGEPLIRLFKNKIIESRLFDYVLIDSRTGFSDEAGICTRDLADHLMILSGLNRQNVQGTSEFLKALRNSTNGNAKFQIILSPVPNGEDKLLEQREEIAKTLFKEAWGKEIDLSLQIPYHPQLSLTEDPHIFRRRRGYLFEAYSAIERRMLDALGHDASTLRQRIREALVTQRYTEALQHLRFLVRLPRGQQTLSMLLMELLYADAAHNRKVDTEVAPKILNFDTLMSSRAGRLIVAFGVDQIQIDEGDYIWERLLRTLEKQDLSLADKLHKRIVSKFPKAAKHLCSYAIFMSDHLQNKEAARDLFQQAVELEPTNADIVGDYAVFLTEKSSNVSETQEVYLRAINLDSKNFRNIVNYADFLASQLHDNSAAQRYFETALQNEPNNPWVLCRYADFLSDRLEDFGMAEKYYELAIEADPEDADNLNNYALFLANQKPNFEKADIVFRRALAAAPNDVGILGGYAEFLIDKKNDFAQAEHIYERAISIDAKSGEILNGYANLLSDHLNNLDGADQYYQRAISLEPDNVDFLLSYAYFLAYQKNTPDLAENIYQKALNIAGDNSLVLTQFAWFQAIIKNDRKSAEELFDKAIVLDPLRASTRQEYALFAVDFVSDTNKVTRLFREALRRKPDHVPTLLNFAAFLYTHRNKLIAAELLFKKAIELDGQNLIALNSYAEFLMFGKKDYDRAEAILLRSLERNEENPRALQLYADLLAFHKDEPLQSVQFYEQALQYSINNYQVLGDLGQILMSLGELDRAQPLFNKALGYLPSNLSSERAELCIAMWTLSRILRVDSEEWTAQFDEFIEKGIRGHEWDFRFVRRAAKDRLDELDYAQFELMVRLFSDPADKQAQESLSSLRTKNLKI